MRSETYEIPILGTYYIIQEDSGRYRIHINGCGIGEHTSLSAARKEIAGSIQDDLLRNLDNAAKLVNELTEVGEKLSMLPDKESIPVPDPHFLGRYMV